MKDNKMQSTDESDITKRPWVILIYTVVLIAICFGLGKIEYNGQDRDEFEAAWKCEFLKNARPRKYYWHDVDSYIDSAMFTKGYVLFNSYYYKNGKRVPFDKLPRP